MASVGALLKLQVKGSKGVVRSTLARDALSGGRGGEAPRLSPRHRTADKTRLALDPAPAGL